MRVWNRESRGREVDDDLRIKWRVARPSNVQSLIELGTINVAYDDETERAQAALRLLEEDQMFGLPRGEIDSEQPTARMAYLETMRRDPFDAQVCFSMFCNVFSGQDTVEPFAMQFARRAIELSPGHGKAHMCAPHAAKHSLPCRSRLGVHLSLT